MLLKIRKILEKKGKEIVNLIYPHRCPICHEILKNQSSLICPECMEETRPIQEPYCKRCGRPVREEQEYCRDCERKKRNFSEGRGIYLYTESMKKSVLLYKYGGRKEYSRFFISAMGFYGRKEIRKWRPDLIVPVPLHKTRLRKRGFNQAELLAQGIGKICQVPVENVLRKRIQTKSQKKLGEKERRQNLRKAFLAEREVRGLRVLLIDDVFTTGSTIDAAAFCLKEAGASEVFFLTLCIASAE